MSRAPMYGALPIPQPNSVLTGKFISDFTLADILYLGHMKSRNNIPGQPRSQTKRVFYNRVFAKIDLQRTGVLPLFLFTQLYLIQAETCDNSSFIYIYIY